MKTEKSHAIIRQRKDENMKEEMKTKLPKEQFIFFIFILLICMVAIVVTVYVQFFNSEEDTQGYSKIPTQKEETLKQQFNELFHNQLQKDDTDISQLKKKQEDKEMIVSSYEKEETKENVYELSVKIPQINLQGEKIEKYNREIENTFQKKAESILASQTADTIYEVKYEAFLYQNILSLVIQSTLKEASNPQRVILQTYHIDLNTLQEISIYDAIAKKQLNQEEVEKKIKEEIQWRNQQAQQLEQMGYTVYKRDEASNIYALENTDNFFFDKEGNLYILYAYGNRNLTSEKDLIIF